MKTVIEMARESHVDVYGLGKNNKTFVAALERFADLIRADEREVWAKDADWCVQNHLEHLIPERIRARGTK